MPTANRIVTSSVASQVVEVCYDSGTAYMEAGRDDCGRLVTGEALVLYTVNASGEWAEIATPDIALLDPSACGGDGCCKGPSDVCFTNGTYTVQTKSSLDLSGAEPVITGGLIIDAGGDLTLGSTFTGEIPAANYVPVKCQYSTTAEPVNEFDCYLKAEPTNTLYNNSGILSRNTTNLYWDDAQFSDVGNDIAGTDDATPHPDLIRDADGILTYNGQVAITHTGNNAFVNSGSANGGLREKEGYWIIPEFHNGEPVSKVTLRWAGTASYSQFMELNLAQDGGNPSQTREDFTTYPLTNDQYVFNPEWYGNAVRYNAALSDLGNGSGGTLYFDIETSKTNGTTGTYNNINPMLYGSSLDNPPDGGQAVQYEMYKRNRATGAITDSAGDNAGINLTDGTLQAVDCGDLPLSGNAYVDPILRSVSVSGVFGGTGPYEISTDGGTTFSTGTSVSLTDDQEFLNVVIKDSKGQISEPLYTGWNTKYPKYSHCWANSIAEADANSTGYTDANGLGWAVYTNPLVGIRLDSTDGKFDPAASENTPNVKGAWTGTFGQLSSTSLSPETLTLMLPASSNPVGEPIGLSEMIYQYYEGLAGDSLALTVTFVDVNTGDVIGSGPLNARDTYGTVQTAGNNTLTGNATNGGWRWFDTDVIGTGTGSPLKVLIHLDGSTGSDSKGHYLGVYNGHVWQNQIIVASQYAKRENTTLLRTNNVNGDTFFEFTNDGEVPYPGNYQFTFDATSSAMDEASTLTFQYSKDGGTTWTDVSTSTGTVSQNQSASSESEPNYADYYHMEGVELSAGDDWPVYRVKAENDGNEWVRITDACIERQID